MLQAGSACRIGGILRCRNLASGSVPHAIRHSRVSRPPQYRRGFRPKKHLATSRRNLIHSSISRFQKAGSRHRELCYSQLGSPREGVIKERMRLGDLLMQAKMITAADVAKALEIQAEKGGRLGDLLVSIGAISQKNPACFYPSHAQGAARLESIGIECRSRC